MINKIQSVIDWYVQLPDGRSFTVEHMEDFDSMNSSYEVYNNSTDKKVKPSDPTWNDVISHLIENMS